MEKRLILRGKNMSILRQNNGKININLSEFENSNPCNLYGFYKNEFSIIGNIPSSGVFEFLIPKEYEAYALIDNDLNIYSKGAYNSNFDWTLMRNKLFGAKEKSNVLAEQALSLEAQETFAPPYVVNEPEIVIIEVNEETEGLPEEEIQEEIPEGTEDLNEKINDETEDIQADSQKNNGDNFFRNTTNDDGISVGNAYEEHEVTPFIGAFGEYKWRKYKKMNSHYLEGRLNGRVAIAVPGTYSLTPPKNLEGFHEFVFANDGLGYWIRVE